MLWERKHPPIRSEEPRLAPANGDGSGLETPRRSALALSEEQRFKPGNGDGLRSEPPEADNEKVETAAKIETSRQTIIAGSALIRGELWVHEDLVINGQFEGTLPVDGHRITVGAGGRVKSELHAREVVVHGSVNGDIKAQERIEVGKTAHIVGNLIAERVVVEAGAYLKGNVNTLR